MGYQNLLFKSQVRGGALYSLGARSDGSLLLIYMNVAPTSWPARSGSPRPPALPYEYESWLVSFYKKAR